MENDFDSILDRITKIENGIDQPDLWETTLSPQKLKVVVEKWKKVSFDLTWVLSIAAAGACLRESERSLTLIQVQNCADEFRTVGETNVGT